MLGLSPTKGLLRRAAVKKQKKRKNYAFRRQFDEKPNISPGAVKKRQIVDGVTPHTAPALDHAWSSAFLHVSVRWCVPLVPGGVHG